MAIISFRDFSCYHKVKEGYVVALDSISLEINEGEFLAVVGESGCGKTTLLKCILSLCPNTSGELLIGGVNADEVKKRDESIAYVSQEYSLYPQMTVYDNIAFSLRMMHTPHNELDERVRRMAKALGAEWLLSRKPRQLSVGQQQRVAIARALVKEPRVVLFDEPFSNLDPALRCELRQLVKRLHEEQRPSIVFVTHELAEAFELAERIIVMSDGAIVQSGSPDELRKNPQGELLGRFLGK